MDLNSLWNYNEPKESEKKFRDLLNLTPISENELYIEILTQISRSEGLQTNFDAAHKTLDLAESMLTQNMVIPQIRYNLERGRVFRSSGFPEKGVDYFLKAYNVANANSQDYYTIDALHMLALIGDIKDQIKWSNIAISHIENSKDLNSKNWLGALLNNTGWSYFNLENYDEALKLFIKTELFYNELGKIEPTIIAKWCQAKMLRYLGRVHESLDLQLTIEKERTDNSLSEDGYIHEEIAECLLTLGLKKEASIRFGNAYNLLSTD
ncbi:MAG: hypothetical protein WAT89_00815, partial [Candidatus Kapaibacterium sp.]